MNVKNFTPEFTRTYATRANAEKAVAKLLGQWEGEQLTYMITPVETEGKIRYGVLFLGLSALRNGIHFSFNIAAF